MFLQQHLSVWTCLDNFPSGNFETAPRICASNFRRVDVSERSPRPPVIDGHALGFEDDLARQTRRLIPENRAVVAELTIFPNLLPAPTEQHFSDLIAQDQRLAVRHKLIRTNRLPR